MKSLVAKYCSCNFSESEYLNAISTAKKKLKRIIEMYGDESGERNKPYYLAQLISEEIMSNKMTQHINSKTMLNMEKSATQMCTHPLNNNHIVAYN